MRVLISLLCMALAAAGVGTLYFIASGFSGVGEFCLQIGGVIRQKHCPEVADAVLKSLPITILGAFSYVMVAPKSWPAGAIAWLWPAVFVIGTVHFVNRALQPQDGNGFSFVSLALGMVCLLLAVIPTMLWRRARNPSKSGKPQTRFGLNLLFFCTSVIGLVAGVAFVAWMAP